MKELFETYLKKNDTVMVIAGKEKGKTAKILKILPKKNGVLLEKLNLRKKYKKVSPSDTTPRLVEVEQAIHISNVQLFCSNCSAPRRIKKTTQDGTKKRICVKCETSFS